LQTILLAIQKRRLAETIAEVAMNMPDASTDQMPNAVESASPPKATAPQEPRAENFVRINVEMDGASGTGPWTGRQFVTQAAYGTTFRQLYEQLQRDLAEYVGRAVGAPVGLALRELYERCPENLGLQNRPASVYLESFRITHPLNLVARIHVESHLKS